MDRSHAKSIYSDKYDEFKFLNPGKQKPAIAVVCLIQTELDPDKIDCNQTRLARY